MKKYPKGAIKQHKRLATGESLAKANTKNLGGDVNLTGGMGKGGTISSSGDTGGPRGKGVPRTGGKTPA